MTHDQVVAMTMGDRVAVMLGELQQVDTPLNLYDRPVNLFVAGFIGSPQMNLIKAHSKEGNAQIGNYLVPVDPVAAQQLGKGHENITVGVRPEAWCLVSDGEGGLPVGIAGPRTGSNSCSEASSVPVGLHRPGAVCGSIT